MPLPNSERREKMKSYEQHHLVPDSDYGWAVIRANSDRISAHADTKAEAERLGREISRNQGTEFIIHGRDGRIQRRDSHGNDPFPPIG